MLMDASMGLFWEMPDGWKEVERLQKTIRDLTAPYEAMRQPVFQNLASALETSYLCEATRMTEICTPAVLKMLQTESDKLKSSRYHRMYGSKPLVRLLSGLMLCL